MRSDPQQKLKFGAVAIGRNEGDRLKRCLASLSPAAVVIYVNSGSTDGSARWAQNWGCDVIELDMSMPFTAARARNSGFRRLQKIAPQIDYVQFVDGDCELVGDWLYAAMTFLEFTSGHWRRVRQAPRALPRKIDL